MKRNFKQKLGDFLFDAKPFILIGLFVLLIAIIVVGPAIPGMISCANSTKTTNNGRVCPSCNRSFVDDTNQKYLNRTNMCRTCYRNYCAATGQKPKDYD